MKDYGGLAEGEIWFATLKPLELFMAGLIISNEKVLLKSRPGK